MKPWLVRATERLLEVPGRLRVERETIETEAGQIVDDYYQVVFSPFSLVVAETADGELVCLEQYRHGPRRVVLGLPGGGLWDDENPLQAAQRELLEETGYEAGDWTELGTFNTLGNQRGSLCTVFRANDARKIRAPDSGDLETARIELLTPTEVQSAVAAGRFGVSGDLAALALAGYSARA